jgi:hypothetical protein
LSKRFLIAKWRVSLLRKPWQKTKVTFALPQLKLGEKEKNGGKTEIVRI